MSFLQSSFFGGPRVQRGVNIAAVVSQTCATAMMVLGFVVEGETQHHSDMVFGGLAITGATLLTALLNNAKTDGYGEIPVRYEV